MEDNNSPIVSPTRLSIIRDTFKSFGKIGVICLVLLLIYFFAGNPSDKISDIMTELIGSIIVGLFGFYIFDRLVEHKEKILKEIKTKELKEIIYESLYGSVKPLYDAGVRKYHKKFPIETIEDLIEKSPKEINILVTWTAHLSSLLPKLIKSTERGCQIKILHLDPSCSLATERERALELGVGSVKKKIESDLGTILNAISRGRFSEPYSIKLKTYNTLPTLGYYQIDDKIFIGWYLVGTEDTNLSWLELEKGESKSKLSEEAFEHFKIVWDKFSIEYHE